MQKLQKFITIIAIAVLAIIIVSGMVYIYSPKKHTMLNLVPHNATNVAFVNTELLAKDFYKLLRRNPTLMDSVTSTQLDNKKAFNQSGNGINPMEGAVIYTFIDSSSNTSYSGIICSIINEKDFIASLTKNPETVQYNAIEDGDLITLLDEGVFIIKKKSNAIIIRNKEQDKTLDVNIAKEQYRLIFSKTPQLLSATNEEYAKFIQQENHIGIWSCGGEQLSSKYLSLFAFTKNIGERTISINNNSKAIDIEIAAQTKDVDAIDTSNTAAVTLGESEIAKLSLSTTPFYLKDILTKSLKKEHHYLLDYCTGALSASITGYRKTPVFTTQITQKIDPNTFATIQAIDTVEANPSYNIPEVIYALKIDNQNALFDTLNKDTLIQNKTGYWTIEHPYFVGEKLFLTLKNDMLYIGTNKEFELATPEFTAFNFVANIPRAIESYPPKNAIQRLAMSAMPELKFSTITLQYNKIEQSKLYLNGTIATTNSAQHSLLILAGEFLNLSGLLKGFI